MSTEPPLASIVIPTFNGQRYLREILTALFSQRTAFPFEVIVIDSGSTDGTLAIVQDFPVRLHKIANAEFNHGETRNLGARLARGQFVAYLTHDATPAGERWLQQLVDAFAIDERVAAVYGPHIPRPDCDPVTRRDMETFFGRMGPPDQATVRRITEGEPERREYEANRDIWAFYSDVNSCLRKSAWQTTPYRRLDYAEDQAFGRDILAAGYWKVYEPRAAVIHSHSYPLLQYLRRQYDEYRGLRQSIGYKQKSGLPRLVMGAFRAGLGDCRYILRQRQYSPLAKGRWMAAGFVMAFFRRLAGYLAAREEKLPTGLKRRLSLEARQKEKTRTETP